MTNQCKERYEQGKIYQIVNDINDQAYIGSTCMPLSKRLYGHKKDCEYNPSKQRQLFQLAREHGWEHFRIRLVEYWPCGDNEQLRMREQHHIDKLKHETPELCLNMVRAYTSGTARREKRRNYKATHRDKIGREEFNRKNNEYQNRPHVTAYRKQYELKHRDRRNARGRELYHYKSSWGGDHNHHNNLLRISPSLFE